MKRKKLSIIIITKNEESTIDACLREANKINFIEKEIILVDSNSTDKTIEIARKYPIKIIKIIKSNVYSPSAGRRIGLTNSKGDYILFLDGDQIVNREWIKKYIALIKLGCFDLVDGGYIHVPYGERVREFKAILNKNPIGKPGNKFHGTFLVRNSKTLKKENFNPFMRGEEERDLAYRLIKKGYKIYRSQEEIAAHFLKKEDTLEVKEKLKFMIGIGQIFKRHIFSRFYLNILKDFKWFFIVISIIILYFFILIFNKYLAFFFILFIFIILLAKNKFKINNILLIIIKDLLMPVKVIEGIFLEIFEKRKFKYKKEIIKSLSK